MNFTFGILTDGKQDTRVQCIIDSIKAENIPNYEIITIGGRKISGAEHISFDETIKPYPWITRKKNLITQAAKYENIVYIHDYIKLLPGWYQGHLDFGNDFTILMDIIINANGNRFRDWTLDPYQCHNKDMCCLLPYYVTDLTQFMYISGSYWVAKKDFMLKYPLDERLYWGCAEDMKWSAIVNKVTTFKMNTLSSVKLIKEGKSAVFFPAKPEFIKELRRRAMNDTGIKSLTIS